MYCRIVPLLSPKEFFTKQVDEIMLTNRLLISTNNNSTINIKRLVRANNNSTNLKFARIMYVSKINKKLKIKGLKRVMLAKIMGHGLTIGLRHFLNP